MPNKEVEQFLKENNIPFQYVNNKLRIYFKYISGHMKEVTLYMKDQKYEFGLGTTSKINMKEHQILTKVFELLGWFDE